MSAPSKQLDQFVVRLPDGMRERIKAAADANNRSMNAEIVAALEEKYPAPLPYSIAALSEALSNAIFQEIESGSGLDGVKATTKRIMDDWLASDDIPLKDKLLLGSSVERQKLLDPLRLRRPKD